MTSEATITEELICKAADSLSAEGVRPTNETVRELLAAWTGTRGGSYTTIGPVLRAWKARRKVAELAEPVREAAPPVVLDRVQGWAAEMWGVALELANSRLASEREALEQARLSFEAETIEAFALAEKREDERDELRRQLEGLNEKLALQRSEFNVQSEKVAASEAKAAELEKRVSEARADGLSVRQERADELGALRGQHEAELKRLALELEAVRKERAGELNAVRAQYEAELKRSGNAHQQALRDQELRSADAVAKLEAAKQGMELELRDLRAQATEAAEQLGRVSGELASLRAQVGSGSAKKAPRG